MCAHFKDVKSGLVGDARKVDEFTQAQRGIDGSSGCGIVSQFAEGERSSLDLQQFT